MKFRICVLKPLGSAYNGAYALDSCKDGPLGSCCLSSQVLTLEKVVFQLKKLSHDVYDAMSQEWAI